MFFKDKAERKYVKKPLQKQTLMLQYRHYGGVNMITEKGTIESKAEYKVVNTAAFSKPVIGWGVLLLIAVAGLIAEIVAGVMKSSWYSLLVLICCCLVIASSAYLVGIYVYMISKSRKEGKWNKTECFADGAVMSVYNANGDKIGEETVKYDKLSKHKEYKECFALYNNSALMYAIGKEGLSLEEQNTLRTILKLPLKDGASAQLPPKLQVSGGDENEQ